MPCDYASQACDETLHLVLETLQAAVKAGEYGYNFKLQYYRFLACYLSQFLYLLIVGHEASASIEPIVAPIVLNMWALHVSDPFISIDAIEVLEVMILSMLLFS